MLVLSLLILRHMISNEGAASAERWGWAYRGVFVRLQFKRWRTGRGNTPLS
jgi:hypothetical protein